MLLRVCKIFCGGVWMFFSQFVGFVRLLKDFDRLKDLQFLFIIRVLSAFRFLGF